MINLEKAVEFVLFDVISPLGCVIVKGRKGMREVISRRQEESERRQKEAKNKEEKK